MLLDFLSERRQTSDRDAQTSARMCARTRTQHAPRFLCSMLNEADVSRPSGGEHNRCKVKRPTQAHRHTGIPIHFIQRPGERKKADRAWKPENTAKRKTGRKKPLAIRGTRPLFPDKERVVHLAWEDTQVTVRKTAALQ